MKKFTLFVLLITFVFGCSKITDDTTVLIQVEDEFNVLLWETLDGNNRTFELKISSIEERECLNSVINVELKAEGNRHIVTLLDYLEEDCVPGQAPARAEVPLSLSQTGAYDLSINLKGAIPNNGRLRVLDEYFELIMPTLNGIVIPHTRLFKVPSSTIWGYAVFPSNDHLQAAQDFQLEVAGLAELKEFQNGYYGHFTISDNAVVDINGTPDTEMIIPFIYEYNGPIEDLQDLIQSYRSNYGNMEFGLFTSSGEVL